MNKQEHSNELYHVLGTVDEFHTPTCHKLYVYAVSLAKQVNEYIEKGWLVICNGRPLKKFIFYSRGSPCVAEWGGNVTLVWVGSSYDGDGKVWLHGEHTKKSIKKMFQKIQIFNPANAVKLDYV